MKLVIAIFLSSMFVVKAQTQIVAVACNKMNVFYKGVSNPISVVIENYPCNKVVVKSNCGKLELANDSCHYKFYTDSCLNSVTIDVGVSDSVATRWISNEKFRVKRLPDPIPTVAGQKGGSISKYVLAAAGGIIPVVMDFDFDIYYTVLNYSFSIERNDSISFQEIYIKGNKLTADIIKAIQKTETNDVVLFYDINAVGPDKEARVLNEMKFIIK